MLAVGSYLRFNLQLSVEDACKVLTVVLLGTEKQFQPPPPPHAKNETTKVD